MTVTTSELRRLFDVLMSYLEETGRSEFDIQEDYYWNINREELYNTQSEPVEMNLGQLSDDWANMKKVIDGESEPIGYHLVWLAPVLREIGETNIW